MKSQQKLLRKKDQRPLSSPNKEPQCPFQIKEDANNEVIDVSLDLQIVEIEQPDEIIKKQDDIINEYLILNQQCDELLSRIAARKNSKLS